MMSCFDENPVELEKPLVWPRMLESHIARSGIRRYSNTHKRKMELKGIRGVVVMEDITEERLEELLAGELFHIGRNNSFDFGRYLIEREK